MATRSRIAGLGVLVGLALTFALAISGASPARPRLYQSRLPPGSSAGDNRSPDDATCRLHRRELPSAYQTAQGGPRNDRARRLHG